MSIRVRDLMSKEVVTLKEGHVAPHADALMAMMRIRHVPVVDDSGALVGLVTHRDLLRAQGADTPVSEIMTKNVSTCEPDAHALTAACVLLHAKFGCLPVVENDRLVGIITEADFLRWSIHELSEQDGILSSE